MSHETKTSDDSQFYLDLLRAYFNSTQDAIFVLCDEKKFLTCNKTTEKWLGYTEDELTAHNRRTPITRLLGEDFDTGSFEHYFHASLQGKPVSFEAHIRPEKGEERWLEISLSRVDIEDGNMVIAVARDISERKLHLATIRYQTFFDELTALPNRHAFLRHLREMEERQKDENTGLVLFMLDIDQFKEINKSLGHKAGDRILQEVSRRLSRIVDDAAGEYLARLGGDDFAIAFPRLDIARAHISAQMIRQILSQPVSLGNTRISLNCAIGIAGLPEHTTNHNQLMQLAEAAMYTAKTEKLGVNLYSPESCDTSSERLEMIAGLREAIKNGGISTCYQPIVNMKTGDIHAEVLARWESRSHGFVAPEKFIQLAEESGQIDRLTSVIIHQSLKQCAPLLQQGRLQSLSINLSPYCLSNSKLPDEMLLVLDRFSLPSDMITLEITESVIMSSLPAARHTLKELLSLGLSFSIDDFGTGYSSLSKLKQMPLKELKIDKSFITDLQHNDNDAAITNAAIQMAHGLGLSVVAEGIEDESTWHQLKSMGCDFGQGFWVARPMPVQEFSAWLEQGMQN